MSKVVVKTIIKFKRGLASEWEDYNPILQPGEPGWESDTNRMKIGDGETAWNNLEYFVDGDGGSGTTVAADGKSIAFEVESGVKTFYVYGFDEATTGEMPMKNAAGYFEWVGIDEKFDAGENITLELDATTKKLKISSPNNPYNYIKQHADYLFETQYSTTNIDYAYANEYFTGASAADLNGLYGMCTGVVKEGRVLRHLDYYYDDNVEFVVRRPADPEAKNIIKGENGTGLYGSIGIAAGIKNLTKSVVESGVYSEKYKLVPFCMCDGINDQGLYIQQNVVNWTDTITGYNINPTATNKCAVTMVIRYILDHCATLADVETFFNTVNIYSVNSFAYGFHFLVAKDNEWRVIELTNTGHVTVTQGTPALVTDNKMPNGIMTNFRTTGLLFTSSDVNESSIEDYGVGVERYKAAEQAFIGTDTLETLRSKLLYSKLYTDSSFTWLSEFCGDTVSGSRLKLSERTSRYSDFVSLWTTEKANWTAKTRSDGKGVWHTIHSSIYDLANKSFTTAIQERLTESFTFSLTESGGGGSVDIDNLSITTNTSSKIQIAGYETAATDKMPKKTTAGIEWVTAIDTATMESKVTQAEAAATEAGTYKTQSGNYAAEAFASKTAAEAAANKYWFGTSTEYNALTEIDPDRIYVITEN